MGGGGVWGVPGMEHPYSQRGEGGCLVRSRLTLIAWRDRGGREGACFVLFFCFAVGGEVPALPSQGFGGWGFSCCCGGDGWGGVWWCNGTIAGMGTDDGNDGDASSDDDDGYDDDDDDDNDDDSDDDDEGGWEGVLEINAFLPFSCVCG